MPAYSIISERPIDGYDLFGRAEAMAQANDLLDRLAAAAGVPTLMDFFSMDPAEVDALFDELGLAAEGEADPDPDPAAGGIPAGPDPDDGVPALEDAPPEQWFAAADGLATVRALIASVEAIPAPAEPDPFDPDPAAVLADLHQFAAILGHLDTAGIRWHLSVDL